MKAQVSIIYILITVAIAFTLAAGIFLFTKDFRARTNEDIAATGLQSVAQQLESALLEIKQLVDTTNITNTEITIKVPERIGEQKYFVAGLGNITELRTVGDPSVFYNLEIKFWPSIDIRGTVDSGKGSITLVLRNSTSLLLQ